MDCAQKVHAEAIRLICRKKAQKARRGERQPNPELPA
jgi:hypothetical protein